MNNQPPVFSRDTLEFSTLEQAEAETPTWFGGEGGRVEEGRSPSCTGGLTHGPLPASSSDSSSDAWGKRGSCLVFLAFPHKRGDVSFIPSLSHISVKRVYPAFSPELFPIG